MILLIHCSLTSEKLKFVFALSVRYTPSSANGHGYEIGIEESISNFIQISNNLIFQNKLYW